MSVVVAYKEKDKVIVACDDRETRKNLYRDSYRGKAKAFVYHGENDFIIRMCWQCRYNRYDGSNGR